MCAKTLHEIALCIGMPEVTRSSATTEIARDADVWEPTELNL